SRQWTGQGGEKQEKTEWHRVICWNNKGAQLADLAEKYMKKGDRIYVEGRVEYRTWEDREKQTRYTTEVIAREVLLLSSRGGGAAPRNPRRHARRDPLVHRPALLQRSVAVARDLSAQHRAHRRPALDLSR